MRNLLRDLLITCTAAQHAFEIMSLDSEQAGIKLPLGGQACAVAIAAERLCDRCDHANLAISILVAPAFRHFTCVIRVERLKRQFGADDVYDQKDAEGFINCFGLPLKVRAMLNLDGTGKSDYDVPDYSKFKRD